MYYPDLTSIAVVEDLPMPEFNLRIHCIFERLGWENGYFGEEEDEPEIEMKPAGNVALIELLARMQLKKKAEAEAEENK